MTTVAILNVLASLVLLAAAIISCLHHRVNDGLVLKFFSFTLALSSAMNLLRNTDRAETFMLASIACILTYGAIKRALNSEWRPWCQRQHHHVHAHAGNRSRPRMVA